MSFRRIIQESRSIDKWIIRNKKISITSQSENTNRTFKIQTNKYPTIIFYPIQWKYIPIENLLSYKIIRWWNFFCFRKFENINSSNLILVSVIADIHYFFQSEMRLRLSNNRIMITKLTIFRENDKTIFLPSLKQRDQIIQCCRR